MSAGLVGPLERHHATATRDQLRGARISLVAGQMGARQRWMLAWTEEALLRSWRAIGTEAA